MNFQQKTKTLITLPTNKESNSFFALVFFPQNYTLNTFGFCILRLRSMEKPGKVNMLPKCLNSKLNDGNQKKNYFNDEKCGNCQNTTENSFPFFAMQMLSP